MDVGFSSGGRLVGVNLVTCQDDAYTQATDSVVGGVSALTEPGSGQAIEPALRPDSLPRQTMPLTACFAR